MDRAANSVANFHEDGFTLMWGVVIVLLVSGFLTEVFCWFVVVEECQGFLLHHFADVFSLFSGTFCNGRDVNTAQYYSH